MLRYIIRRILYAAPILMGVCLRQPSFCSTWPFLRTSSLGATCPPRTRSQQEIQDWLQQHGYDRPEWSSFADHMLHLALFDFGNSDRTASRLAQAQARARALRSGWQLPMFVAEVYVAIFLALVLAYYRGTYLDLWGLVVSVMGMSIPHAGLHHRRTVPLGKLLRLFPFAGYGQWDHRLEIRCHARDHRSCVRDLGLGPLLSHGYVGGDRSGLCPDRPGKGRSGGTDPVHSRPEERGDSHSDVRGARHTVV